MKIKIEKKDINPYVYFVCSMAQESQNPMHGMSSSKSDYIGGIFDRWINIIPESLIFNKYILPLAIKEANVKKDVVVFSDFFKYDPKNVGIAPDVLGLQIGKKIIPFVKYDDTKEKKKFWVAQDGCPQIEVKSFKEKQYMVSLRNQNYENKYLVMVETNLAIDYLLPYFNNSFIANDELMKLKMPNEFIVSNGKGLLAQTKEVSFEKDNLGTIELLSITTGNEFMQNSIKCLAGESPRYIKNIQARKIKIKNVEVINNMSFYFENCDNGLYNYNNNWHSLFSNKKEKLLSIYFSKISALSVIRVNKSALVVVGNEDCYINKFFVKKDTQYTIYFDVLDRTRKDELTEEQQEKGCEYFYDKQLIEYLPNKQENLLNALANVIRKN